MVLAVFMNASLILLYKNAYKVIRTGISTSEGSSLPRS